MGVNIDSKDIISLLNIPKRKVLIISFTIMIFTGLFLFLPDSIINKLFLDKIRNSIGAILGIVFLISVVLVIVILLICVFDFIANKYKLKKLKKRITKYLLENKNEVIIQIIKELLKEKDHTGPLPYNNGATAELTSRGIISLTSANNPVEFGDNNEMFTNYFLQPFIIEIIENNEELRKKYKK